MFLCIEVCMTEKTCCHFFTVILALAFYVSSVFAAEVDCRDYSSTTDSRCSYSIIEQPKGIQLFVVAEGDDPQDFSKALKNEDFYVYAPLADNDSVKYTLWADQSEIKNRQKVNSGDEGYVIVGVTGLYPKYNVVIGTATKEDMSDRAIVRVYNFYVPDVQYCLDEDCNKPITSKTMAETKLEVSDTITIYVRMVVPEGPDSGSTEKLTKMFYINTEGQSDSLIFMDMVGDHLVDSPLGLQLPIEEGRGKFRVTSLRAVIDGSTFTLDGYPDVTADGDTTFLVSEEFPGGLRFDNHNMPTIDSAYVYDTNGDGVGDSIAVFFGGNMEFIDIDDFEYDWPENGKYTTFGGDESHKGNVYGLSDAKMDASADSAKGLIRAHVTSTNSGEKGTVGPAALEDRIGPVIKEASIIKGKGDTDTLVVRFSKDIDTSWTSGKGLVLNGKSIPVEAFKKDGDVWSFAVSHGVVDEGDSLQIAISCANDACPDGLIKAADGNETGKNNPCVVKNAGQLYADDENNGFYDRNGDGRMDSASVAFDVPLQKSDLKNLDVMLYWLDSNREVVQIPLLNLDSLMDAGVVTLSNDGKILGVNIDPEEYDIRKMLTSIDKSQSKSGEAYGYAEVINTVTVNGEVENRTTRLSMNDRIPPQITGTFLRPESFQKMEADELVLEFSEAISYKNVEDLSEALLFSGDGKSWKGIDLNNVQWADDGKSVTIRMEVGSELDQRMNPADFVRFNEDCEAFKDASGNGIFKEPLTVMLQGDPRVLAKTTSLATKDFADLLSDKKDFTVRFVPADSSLTDEMKMSLGVLMNIGFSTMMTKDSTGKEVLDLEKIGLSWEMYVYTNLGGYVASSSGEIYCNDSYFNPEGKIGKEDGNCLENPKKLYFRWNMRSENGRKVGIGVYLAKFKVKVFGAKESFEYERYYNWGVKAGKNGLDLKSLEK